MIPNSAPMAAVYLSVDKKMRSSPVVAWDTLGKPVVPSEDGTLVQIHTTETVTLLGLLTGTWTPSLDDMASLLPQHIPGTPDPLATRVIIRELPDGWVACRTEGGGLLRKEATFHELEAVLSAVGGFLVEKIIRTDES